MRTLTSTLLAAAAASLAFLALAGNAAASSSQLKIMQDDPHVVTWNTAVRHRTLREFKALGADAVKISLQWSQLAPRRRPRNPANPANYRWNALPTAVNDIRAFGMRPFLAFSGYGTPRYAGRGGRNDHVNVRQFGLFAQAAGRQFPSVDLWSIWNEPNLPNWLKPQRTRAGTPLAPHIFRRLYLAGHSALSRTGHRNHTILMAELFSGGSGPKFRRVRIGPLDFLREMACLDRRYRAFRGRAARVRGCPRRVRIPTSGLAYHPYTEARPPWSALWPGDAGIARLGRVTSVLDRIARRGRLRRGLKIWITEYGFQTRPPDPFGRPIGVVPNYMDYAERTAFRSGRVASYMHYQLIDERPARRGSRIHRWFGWQSGLYTWNWRKKPSVYLAWQMPAYVKLGRRGVELFAGLKTASATLGTPVTVESSTGFGRGPWRPLTTGTLSRNGYFRKFVRVGGAGQRLYRFRIGGLFRYKAASRR